VLLPQDLADAVPAAPRASGTLASHYAPRARVRLFSAETLRAALADLPTDRAAIAVYGRTLAVPGAMHGTDAVWRQMPPTAAATAQQLFAVLRELDSTGVAEIWVETPPQATEWIGVMDRLQRAAA
jgi:L-threonylcarbamoyladenylate synthase